MNAKRRSSARRSKANKAKRPKFLRLRLQFPADEGIRIVGTGMGQITGVEVPAADSTSDQLNLFPLQPENQVEERESTDHENVAFFFSAADGGASTLSGLLETCAAGESISSHANDSNSRLHCLPPPSPASLTQAYGEERAALERNALRNRDRDSSEEKWVCYSEVVKEEEVTSSAVDPTRPPGIQRMSLKLDYEEIMNAWSNKGPLYIDATDNTSQIVPDISHHFLLQEPSNYIGLNSGFNGGSWIVPDIAGDMESGEMMNVSRNEDHLLKMGHREASVMRYKEKRQNRLFSKKIRYQVRKLNAEKRPRLKGRFVKRS